MKPGYTLLEMLISVAIFSGLVILILAVFVRTTSSSARVNVLREKSEVARSAMGQVTNDFHYIYKTKPINLLNGEGALPSFTGYSFETRGGSNTLVLALKYPNTTDEQFVVKRYITNTITPESRYLKIREYRGCTLQAGKTVDTVDLQSCDNFSTSLDQPVLPDDFVLDNNINVPIFSGAVINPKASTGYLKIALTLKPTDYQNVLCGAKEVASNICYKVETILGAGGLR